MCLLSGSVPFSTSFLLSASMAARASSVQEHPDERELLAVGKCVGDTHASHIKTSEKLFDLFCAMIVAYNVFPTLHAGSPPTKRRGSGATDPLCRRGLG